MLNLFKKDEFPFQLHTQRGKLVLRNPENENLIGLTPNLRDLFDINTRIGPDLVITRFKSPAIYFIHCDVFVESRKYCERKPSDLLTKFSIPGNTYEKVDYIAPPHHVLRDVDCGDKHLHSLTISVRDENGDLFDFSDFPLEFELEIK